MATLVLTADLKSHVVGETSFAAEAAKPRAHVAWVSGFRAWGLGFRV